MDISILFYILSAILILILILLIRIEFRFRKLFSGTKAKNLEELVGLLKNRIEKIEEIEKETKNHLSIVDKRLDKSIRKIQTVRFNPFGSVGSNQSFAISMLNDEGDGLILSSLYARDRISIFAKPIKKGNSDFELSKEEKEVLEKSK